MGQHPICYGSVLFVIFIVCNVKSLQQLLYLLKIHKMEGVWSMTQFKRTAEMITTNHFAQVIWNEWI